MVPAEEYMSGRVFLELGTGSTPAEVVPPRFSTMLKRPAPKNLDSAGQRLAGAPTVKVGQTAAEVLESLDPDALVLNMADLKVKHKF